MKWLAHILAALFIAGCGGAVQQSWTNFRAHYNTYYNAEKSFHTGRQKVLSQKLSIDPAQPIRVHRARPQAGAVDFQNTIDKGARIIRRFPDSKWTDNTLFLMGKSYYYRKEYYLGLQKFEELYEVARDPELKQQSVIWKGRTYLDLKQYREGLSFLEEKQADADIPWQPAHEAELKVLIAEHHTMLGSWQQAHDQLKASVTQLDSRSMKMRALFLFAQVLDRLGQYEQAYVVFDQVTSIYTNYEYSYWAELNKAKIARKTGNLDQALYMFKGMLRDDKNFDRMDEISYQIARTEQEKGDIKSSEMTYRRLLNASFSTPGPGVRSKTYYQLGKIYSENYKAYETAAAYFDSSSAMSQQGDEWELEGPAADSYQSYASLKFRLQHIDSLLALGNLSRAKLDSTLRVIRKNRTDQLLATSNEGQNVLTNRVEGNRGERGESNATNDFGFLNYRNARLASAASDNFRAIWGDRPLADNWRRAEAIRVDAGQQDFDAVGNSRTGVAAAGLSDEDLNIDISEIPRTAQEKKEAYREKANTQYQLGNLFFLSFNSPDSAEAYFRKVMENSDADESLAARAGYALHQLYKSYGRPAKAEELAQQIRREYKGTVYAQRIRRQGDVDASSAENALLQQVEKIEQAGQPVMVKASTYRSLALKNVSSRLAPHIHFRSLQAYLEQAKSHADSAAYNTYWTGDSSRTASRPGSLFAGAYWDSVRVLVDEHLSVFSSQPYSDTIAALDSTLAAHEPSKPVPSCARLGIEARIKPNMETFLSSVVLPGEFKGQNLSGSISYMMTISAEGTVEEFEIQTTGIPPSLNQAYAAAIQEKLAFYPFALEDGIEHIRCRVSFPVGN